MTLQAFQNKYDLQVLHPSFSISAVTHPSNDPSIDFSWDILHKSIHLRHRRATSLWAQYPYAVSFNTFIISCSVPICITSISQIVSCVVMQWLLRRTWLPSSSLPALLYVWELLVQEVVYYFTCTLFGTTHTAILCFCLVRIWTHTRKYTGPNVLNFSNTSAFSTLERFLSLSWGYISRLSCPWYDIWFTPRSWLYWPPSPAYNQNQSHIASRHYVHLEYCGGLPSRFVISYHFWLLSMLGISKPS